MNEASSASARAPTPPLLFGRRRARRLGPALRAIAARPGFREDVRFFAYAYVGAFVLFMTWLA